MKTAAARLGNFLSCSPFPIEEVTRHWIMESLALLPPEVVCHYHGKAVVVIDPTVYTKESFCLYSGIYFPPPPILTLVAALRTK